MRIYPAPYLLYMYHIYVIQSLKNKSLYFGFTKDLEKRLALHNTGKVRSTSVGKPWIIVYSESYRNEKDARTRELTLKQYGNARTYVKRRIEHSLNK